VRYHVPVHSLAERVLAHIRRDELLRPGDRVGVAVSGGIDSVALLRLLIELRQEIGVVLSIVHFNHKLRSEASDVDQEFVAGLAREHGLEFYCESGDVAGLAAAEHSGVEAAARAMRYGFFERLLGSAATDTTTPTGEAASEGSLHGSAQSAAPPKSAIAKIATGHTLDDQAETVLMRLIRGTGPRGLGGIYPRVIVEHEEDEGHGEIIRPLLGIRRGDLEQYLKEIKQPWREDSSNADSKFTRNRVRQLILPLLEKDFNPSVVENLSELAAIARDEEDYWENEISGWLGTVVQWSEPSWTRDLQNISLVQIEGVGGPGQNPPMDLGLRARIAEAPWLVMNASVSRPWLLTEPLAVQRRVLKAIGEQAGIPLEFKHIEEILRFASDEGPSGKELSLPLGWKLLREPEAMVFLTPDLRREPQTPDYEYQLTVPGRVTVFEIGVTIEALCLQRRSGGGVYNPQQLLNPSLLLEPLIVRNWRAGDRFWPAHTKAPKKIKELLQERQIEQPGRKQWPVVASGNEIVWMRGFPVSSRLRAQPGDQAILITEVPRNQE